VALSHKVLLAAFLLLLAGCGGSGAKTAEPGKADPVTDVRNVLDVRAAFEADAGKTRLLVLLAPT
jgi:hypothetical protein